MRVFKKNTGFKSFTKTFDTSTKNLIFVFDKEEDFDYSQFDDLQELYWENFEDDENANRLLIAEEIKPTHSQRSLSANHEIINNLISFGTIDEEKVLALEQANIFFQEKIESYECDFCDEVTDFSLVFYIISLKKSNLTIDQNLYKVFEYKAEKREITVESYVEMAYDFYIERNDYIATTYSELGTVTEAINDFEVEVDTSDFVKSQSIKNKLQELLDSF